MTPLGLYIHIPWCEKKCPYCDFNSHQARETVDETSYVDALLYDLDSDLALYDHALRGRAIESIFIGGGTPSLFSAESMNNLLEGVGERIEIKKHAEVTLEANPGSAEANKFTQFRAAGINRLSIGVQSFNNEHLTVLGRVHSAQEAIRAAEFAHSAGFDKFNIDLMFGLPKQSLEQCMQDLNTALDLSPPHLSCYQLTIEPNTLFHHNPPVRPDDESLWHMQTALQKRINDAGYHQYEVSAYAKPDNQCQHNLNYWRFGDYLGIGAGAHGKVSGATGIERYWKIKHPKAYLRKISEGESLSGARNQVEEAELAFEFMLNALRLSNGFSPKLFEQTTNLNFAMIRPIIERHQQQGLMTMLPNQVLPTERGKTLIDTMLQDYLPD